MVLPEIGEIPSPGSDSICAHHFLMLAHACRERQQPGFLRRHQPDSARCTVTARPAGNLKLVGVDARANIVGLIISAISLFLEAYAANVVQKLHLKRRTIIL